ncbi:BMP family ABC transporter substrate-binding protein [Jiangella ureilytica]|uniref:BMP family ABC transporter substrate-binding protein n=1 Tax=Jiangella ureilytica TaxID=2530374 RepID=A0A4V2XVV6_9ACTN|nr:BMP family ABC transporter substrate-binding protein [Jiangella ureilytica]TDC46865.1 BMP family ABC transporter substrate-binding protein [Jiangella ureilytica]
MNKRFRLAAALSVVALAVAACGEAPDEEGGGGDGTSTAGGDGGGDFAACMVSDQGGINDRSFNETSYNGLVLAQEEGIIAEPKFAESQTDADYGPNVDAMVQDDCGIIVTVGFLLADATREAAEANPEERFAIVDFQYADETGAPTPIDNVKPLVFNTQEAAFLAGYASAAHSTTGIVGTWGGAKIPTVTIFMDGFYDGVQYYNEQKGAQVQVLGWDKATQEGQFVGDFANTGLARQISDNLISQGADVLHPVAGPLAESAAIAAQAAGNVAVVWADSDGFESAPDYGDVILTSVLKGMDQAVLAATQEAADDAFTNEPYIGTLENGGVGIAPFHDFDSTVTQETKDELAQIQEQIISGELTVESDAAFS